jgi:dephospho-CoA kinase
MRREGLTVIGLTGGVGSGKSTVSAYLSEKGYPVIDADKAAREIVLPGSPVLGALARVFGREILNEDGTLNRKKLASIAFGDRSLKAKMDDIMHGEIYRLMKARVGELALSGYKGLVFLDIPLLFETGGELLKEIDETWVADACEETRIKRVVARDGTTREEVEKIIKNQMDGSEKRAKADVVIDNSGSAEALYAFLDELLETYES